MLPLILATAIGFESFAFLQGEWCAQALGGEVVERWEAPVGDAMSGTMTVVRQGKVAFHEFFVLTDSKNGWEMRLKHFNPNMVSWEEKDEVVVFPLLRATTRELEFEGLTMEQRVPGVDLDVTVNTPDGKQIVFNYRRCD